MNTITEIIAGFGIVAAATVIIVVLAITNAYNIKPRNTLSECAHSPEQF